MGEQIPNQEFLSSEELPELETIDQTPHVRAALETMTLRDAAIDLDVAADLDDPSRLRSLAERFSIDAAVVRGKLEEAAPSPEVQGMKKEYNESMDRILEANTNVAAGTLDVLSYVEVIEGEQRALHDLRERLQETESPR